MISPEESEKYLEIVRNGNMDDMYDFGHKKGAELLAEKVRGFIAQSVNLAETNALDWSEDIRETLDQALKELEEE